MDDEKAEKLVMEVVPAAQVKESLLEDILTLCERAYGADHIRGLYKDFASPVHVIGYLDGVVASHAMWVTRWLRAGDGPLLRTAYSSSSQRSRSFKAAAWQPALCASCRRRSPTST
jgi:hypothetical protein